MKKTEMLVLREEEHIKGNPVRILAVSEIPMNKESRDKIAEAPWNTDADHWRVEWWEGYGQAPTVDIYAIDSKNPDDEFNEGFMAEQLDAGDYAAFFEICRKLAEGQLIGFIYPAIDYDDPECD